MGYTIFERVHDSQTNLRLVAKPDFRITGGASYSRGKFSAMLTCMHQGKTPGTQTVDSSGRATQYDKVAASTLLDLGLRHELSHDCSIYVNVENLTDKDDAILIQGSDLANKFGLLRDPLVYNNGRKTVLGMELKF
jgi:outer membrane receptor for ferrienterochelin and colicin